MWYSMNINRSSESYSGVNISIRESRQGGIFITTNSAKSPKIRSRVYSDMNIQDLNLPGGRQH